MFHVLRCFAAALAILAAQVAASAAERRVALVIGNSAYQNVPALDNPAHDARAIADRLEGLGFQVIAGYDLGKAATQTAIAKFAEAARDADIALFFYAGHGMQVDGVNYMAPVDADIKDDISLDFETVPIEFVWRQMSRGAKVRIVLLDACRDNPFARALARSGASTPPAGGLAEMQIEPGAKAGALIAFATSPGRVAYDGTSGHSPFTAGLVAHLGDPDAPLTTVMTRVTADVLAATNGAQRPWVSASLTGDVVLNRTASAAATGGTVDPDQLAEINPTSDERLHALVRAIDAGGAVRFDAPIKVGEPAIDGKSLAELIAGKPLFSPIDGLDKAEWDRPCASCHQWNRERLCTQSQRYDQTDAAILRGRAPLRTALQDRARQLGEERLPVRVAASFPPRPARGTRALGGARREQDFADFVALFVDRGDHQPHRHADVDEQRLGELQARLDGFRHRVGDPEPVEDAGVGGVAGARDQRDVALQLSRGFDHRFVGARRIHGDDDGARRLDAAATQIFLPRGVAEIDLLALSARFRRHRGVGIDGDIGNRDALPASRRSARRRGRSRR